MTTLDREANVLGALALVITDQTMNAIAAAAGQSASAAAALSALHHFLDRPTLDKLRRVLGLTHSGAVRLVDRLASAGLVTRGPGSDGRTRSVELTEEGRRAADRVSQARAALLGGVLAELSTAEPETLGELLGRLMAGVVNGKEEGGRRVDLPPMRSAGVRPGRRPMPGGQHGRRQVRPKCDHAPIGLGTVAA